MDEKNKEIIVASEPTKDGEIAVNEAAKPEIVIETKQEQKKELTKEEKDHRSFITYATVLIIVILISISCFFYFKSLFSSSENNNCKDIDSSSSDQASSQIVTNEISITDSRVLKLSSLFEYEDKGTSKLFPSINSKVKVIASTLILDHQLSIAINDYLKSNSIVDAYATCDDLAATNFIYSCNDENFALIENNKMIIYRFTATQLSDSFNNIFGNQSTIIHKNFTTANGIECFYSTDYLCLKGDQDPAGIEAVSYIVKAYDYTDRIEIQTKYVWIEGVTGYSNVYHDTTYFNNYFANPAISEELNVKQNYEELIPLTKHIFKKDSSGNYYWDSSEIVTVE